MKPIITQKAYLLTIKAYCITENLLTNKSILVIIKTNISEILAMDAEIQQMFLIFPIIYIYFLMHHLLKSMQALDSRYK